MVTSLMWLIGPLGALPTVYTEEIVGPAGRHRGAAVDFFDQLQHRMFSLFYRAWEKSNLPALWEKDTKAGSGPEFGGDAFTVHFVTSCRVVSPRST